MSADARPDARPDALPADGTGPVVDVRDAFCLHPVPDGAVAALRGLTLTVAAGERVVVHGPNGSGKTTLLRVLAGEQRLSAGRAVVAGVDVGAAAGALAALARQPARLGRPAPGADAAPGAGRPGQRRPAAAAGRRRGGRRAGRGRATCWTGSGSGRLAARHERDAVGR